MRRHLGLIIFGASLTVALAVYVTLVAPVRREIGSLVERILAMNLADIAELRFNHIDLFHHFIKIIIHYRFVEINPGDVAARQFRFINAYF